MSTEKIIENGNTYYVFNLDENLFYYKDEQCQIRHRVDGPAIKYWDGDKSWFKDGKKHRIDGPAEEWSNGRRHYFLNGIEYTEEEYWKIIKLGSFV